MLETLKPYEKARSCRVRTILSELDAKDAAILTEALKDQKAYPHSYLSKRLKERDIMISDIVIARHRQGICSC